MGNMKSLQENTRKMTYTAKEMLNLLDNLHFCVQQQMQMIPEQMQLYKALYGKECQIEIDILNQIYSFSDRCTQLSKEMENILRDMHRNCSDLESINKGLPMQPADPGLLSQLQVTTNLD